MGVELRDDDALRLHVLLTQAPQAIRIDETALRVEALTPRGTASVPLHPSGREEFYLRSVREFLSSQVLGSPGGYPVFLRRWTRMGQARDGQLERLLLLAEPEAVVAVVCAPGLSDELARRAWWAMPSSDNARRMLANPKVAGGDMGPELVRYLVEYLPFEEAPAEVMQTVHLVLAAGCAAPEVVQQLWRGRRHRAACRVGFLAAIPDELPEPAPPHPDAEAAGTSLASLCRDGNPVALQLCRTLEAPGQTFVQAAAQALGSFDDQEVVAMLLNAIGDYFAPIRAELADRPARDLAGLAEAAQGRCDDPTDRDVAAVLQAAPGLRPQLTAALTLSWLDDAQATATLARTDAVGSLLRRKLLTVTEPIGAQLDVLGAGGVR